MISSFLVTSVLATQNGAVLELTGDAPKVEFGGALTLIHNATEDKLTCSGKIQAADVLIEGTSTTVADLIGEMAVLRQAMEVVRQEMATMKAFVGMMPPPPSPAPAQPSPSAPPTNPPAGPPPKPPPPPPPLCCSAWCADPANAGGGGTWCCGNGYCGKSNGCSCGFCDPCDGTQNAYNYHISPTPPSPSPQPFLPPTSPPPSPSPSAPSSLLFGDSNGIILASANTYWADVHAGSWGDVPCIRNIDGCTWGAATSSSYVEVRFDQQSTVTDVTWSGFGYNTVTFSYRVNPTDSNWIAFIDGTQSGTASPYHPPNVGPISDLRFQMSGPHWCKLSYLRIVGTA